MKYPDAIALVTGGAGGLGKAFARELLARGAKVCIADINETAGKGVLHELESEFSAERVSFAVCDVTGDESFKGAFDRCKETLGPVNLLINNAGCNDETNWKFSLDINLGGCIRGTELGLEQMGKHKGHNGGHIVNVSSIAGLKTVPFGPFYGACKAGIVHYTRSVGHPFHVGRTGVHVQSICPSLVDTPFMKESFSKAYSPESAAVAKAMYAEGKHPVMSPEVVSAAMIKLLDECKPGAAMAVEANKEPYYVDPSIA